LTVAMLSLLVTGFLRVNGQDASNSNLSLHLSLLGFTLERNTLADVQHKLGAAKEGACSEEAEASKTICYASSGTDGIGVFFESGSSGAWTKLDGFRVVSGGTRIVCHLQCRRPATAFGKNIQTGGGLKLGLNREEVIALLGPPAKLNGDQLTFESWSKRPMTKSEVEKAVETFKESVKSPYWDVHDVVEVTLSDSKVAEFAVHHTVTY
jgi:hypothetical protein